ncbi:MAG TPA: sialidase family protein [Terrimicrobiaceae bacterium]|nr:sialidase family protein [Terrimicrobiaceae bacterium]
MRKPRSGLLPRLLFGTMVALAAGLFAQPVSAPDGPPPGTIIARSPDPARVFVASPGIAQIPNGDLIAAHDWSGPGSPGTRTSVYRSRDAGQTWTKISDVRNFRWATLFFHRGALYLFGVAKSFGNIVIARSTDEGVSWTTPSGPDNGILAEGRFHTGPVPVLVSGGRIWRAFELAPESDRNRAFSALVLSAPEDADLLRRENWRQTNAVSFDPTWLNIRAPEWIEGNVVAGPDGTIWNVLRTNTHPRAGDTRELTGGAAGLPRFEVAAFHRISPDGRTAAFDPATGFRHFPGAQSKFAIRFDPVSQRYWAIVNRITNKSWTTDWALSPHHQRNVLALISSSDLRTWTESGPILRFAEGKSYSKADRTGFQYADWIIAGDDILAAVRTAWQGENYHDANFITFHRIKNFRNFSAKDAPPDLAGETTP